MNDLHIRIVERTLQALKGPPVCATATVMSRPAGDGGPAVGEKMLFAPGEDTLGSLGGGPLEEAVGMHIAEALAQHYNDTVWLRPDGSLARRTDEDTFQVFIEVFEPPETLVIVGGGHIGLSLAIIGEHVGFSVVVLDDRPEYANRDRFAMADTVICGDFVEELEKFPIDASTYIVVVTRGHKQDEVSVRTVVGRGARYVGMIGSKRRVGAVLQYLLDDGLDPEALAGVHTPIGLDIGSETPAEIAVSIIAEIISVRRGGTLRPMHEQRTVLKRGNPAAPST